MERNFSWPDWLLFSLVILISLVIGVYAAFSGGRQKTTSEVLMGNRKLGLFPVTMSIFMSFVSAIMVIGNTTETYLYGIQGWLIVIGSIISYVFCAHVIVPVFYKLRLTSSFEYLEKRFDFRPTRIMGDILLILSQVIYMGIATFAPATAMQISTGFPEEASIVITIVVATFYTAIGGMKAVVWTDAIQGLIYLVGVLVILIEGVNKVGGIVKVWEIADRDGRLSNFSWDPNPYGARMSIWSCTFGIFVGTIMTMGVNQASVQRYSSLPTLTKAKWCLVLITPAEIIGMTLTCLIGLVVYAHYAETGCDPIRGKLVQNTNQLLPYFIQEVVTVPGIPGLFMAVLFAGSLSTLSSCLSALSAVTWKDLMESRLSHLSEATKALITKSLAVLYGVISMGLSFAIRNLGAHVMQLANSLVTAATGPILGMFLLGFFFPWANGIGATIGAIVAVIFSMWIAIGSNISNPWQSYLDTNVSLCQFPENVTAEPIPEDKEDVIILYKMSFYYYDAMAATIVIIVALAVSLCTGPKKPSEMDPGLIVPFFDKLFCCLPKSWRRKLWCGVPHDTPSKYTHEDYSDYSEESLEKETPEGAEIPLGDSKGTKEAMIAELESADIKGYHENSDANSKEFDTNCQMNELFSTDTNNWSPGSATQMERF